MLYQLSYQVFFQAEDGIRDVERSRGLGDVYKRQTNSATCAKWSSDLAGARTQDPLLKREMLYQLSYQV